MRFILLGLASLSAIAAPAAAQGTRDNVDKVEANSFGLTFTTGIDFSSGDYGALEKTEIVVVPLSVRATSGPLAFTASLPYLRIDSPGGVVLGPDGRPLPGVPATDGKRSGFGDLSLGAAYTTPSLGGLEFTLGTRVKLPTANKDEQLSTGETDVSASLDATYSVGNVAPFVAVGYRVLGDPEGFDLRDGPTASVGSSFTLGKAVLIASYDYARSTSAAVEDSQEIFAGLSVPATDRFTLTGYGIKGLSNGSPDYGVGLLLTTRLR